MEKKAKNILIYAASLAALMLTASCNKEINEMIDDPAAPTVHSIEVTVPVATDTKASYAGGGSATTFEAGDKLYIKVQSGDTYTYVGVLGNSADAVSTFTGTLNLTAGTDYSGSDIITDCTSLEATLLPKGYDGTYYVLTESGTTVTGLTVEPAKAFSSAATKAAAVPQVANASYSTTGSGAKAITLTPQNAVLYYTLSGLAASTSIDVTVSDGTTTVSGSVTTDDSGVATFAVGYAGGAGTKTYTVSTSGKDDDAVTASLEAKRVYNVTRFMYPVGAIHGQFTVSSGKKVCFSKGNLQYIGSAATPYWKFADNQWNYLSTNGSDATNVDRDLFGWGTSGSAPSDQTARAPYYTTQNNSDYVSNITTDGESWGENSEWDWGHNAISNGGNTADTWRTLTKDEWVYLINVDNSGSYRQVTVGSDKKAPYGHASVNGVNGLVLLPDGWDGSVHSGFTYGKSSWSNVYTESSTPKWSEMESAGCVFLPAAGYRLGTGVFSVGDFGGYWSSTAGGSDDAYGLNFFSSNVFPAYGSYRCDGYSVRLVQNLN